MKFRLSESQTADLDALVDTRLLIQANSGGGKSWALRRLLEQTHGHVQHLVIDPEGEFASLREKYDYVLAARNGGDTGVDPRAAKLLAERLLELGASAIVDIYELKAHDRIRFVRQFLEALVDAPKRLWHPALVVVDEAHVFCPQKGEAESAGAVIDLATRGRKRGFCAILATQRLSKLHKDAAAECNNKLIGRTGLDVDVQRAADELGLAKPRWKELRDLEPGEFFAFGPALSREVVKLKTGPVQTRHPKAGARLAFVPPAPTAKIRALLPKLADLPAEVEQKAKTEAELRSEISTLKREMKARPSIEVAKPEVRVERVEVPVLRATDIAGIETLQARVLAVLEAQRKQIGDLVSGLEGGFRLAVAVRTERIEEGNRLATIQKQHATGPARVTGSAGVTRDPKTPASPSFQGGNGHALRQQETRRREGERKELAGGKLPLGERRILTAIAQHSDGVTREQLTVLTGYKRSSRDAYLQRLRERDLIQSEANGQILATPDGVDSLGPSFEPLPTGDELRRHWMERLPEGERKVLEVLVGAYPQDVDRALIDEATGYRRSSRDAYLQRLGARRLVIQSGRGAVKASGELFG